MNVQHTPIKKFSDKLDEMKKAAENKDNTSKTEEENKGEPEKGDPNKKEENKGEPEKGNPNKEDSKDDKNQEPVAEDLGEDNKDDSKADGKADVKKKPPKPKEPPDKGGESLEDIEKEFNKTKTEVDRKQHQMKQVAALLAVEEEKLKKLTEKKQKVLSSPANTEKIKERYKRDVTKKLAKAGGSDSESEDGNESSDDSNASLFSQAWSVFGKSRVELIRDKLERALGFAKRASEKYSTSREVLKTARESCQEAQRYVDKKRESIDMADVPGDQAGLIDNLYGDVDDMILILSNKIDKLDKVRSDKATGVRPSAPTWDPSHPSRFLSFHGSFKEMFKHQDSRIKCENYKSCIVGPRKSDVHRLLAGVTMDFDLIESIMYQHYGDISILIPSERQKVESLVQAQTYEDEKANLLVILEYHNLLNSHNAVEQYFDRHLWFIIRSKLQPYHRHDLEMRKPTNNMAFVARLETYLKDITEYQKVIPSVRAEKVKNGSNSGSSSGSGAGAPVSRTNTSYTKKYFKCNLCENDDHRTSECHRLRNKDIDAKKKIFQSKNCCPACLRKLDERHDPNNCKTYFNKKVGKKMFRTCKCRSGLNYFVCCKKEYGSGGSGGPSTASNKMDLEEEKSGEEEGEEIVLNNSCSIGEAVTNCQVLKIKVPGTESEYRKVLCIFDSQSQNCLFSNELKKLMKNYKKTLFSVNTNNNTDYVEDGGVGQLTVLANNKEYQLKGLVKKFHNHEVRPACFKIPREWQDKYDLKEEMMSDAGKLSVILGADCLNYFPTKVDEKKGVILEKSFFDNKLILSGFDKEIVSRDLKGRETASNRAALLPLDKAFMEQMAPGQRFVSPGLCEKHRGQSGCFDCKNQLQTKTRVEIHEERLLGDGLSFDKVAGRWRVEAPYLSTIKDVPEGLSETTAAMERLVRRLKNMKNGEELARNLDETVKKNLDSEMWKWEADILEVDPSYGRHQRIVTPINFSLKAAGSTKVRLVHNLSHQVRGKPSLNDAQFKGTSLNKKLHLILLRQRGFLYMASNDIIKFYNQILQSPADCRKHSFLYRRGGLLSTDPWEIVSPQSLLFGAKMSQNLSNEAKIRTSQMFILPQDENVHQDILYSYTDDLSCFSNEGRDDLERKKKIMEDGMKKGGFSLKQWRSSYERDEDEALSVSGCESILGLFYKPSIDSWNIKCNVNFSKKQRNLRPLADQIKTREELDCFIDKNGLTKVQCLQSCYFLFDPLNLLMPLRANLSLLYRQLLMKYPEMCYHDKLKTEDIEDWRIAIGNLLDVDKVTIQRCCLPPSYKPQLDQVSLCVFVDGGGGGSVTRCYLRTTTRDPERFYVSNLMNSYRLGELGAQAAPKTEITSLLNGAKNIELIKKVLEFLNIKKVFLFSDSTVTLGCLRAHNFKLKLFFSERVLEIQQILESEDVKCFHIESDLNLANYGSKLDLKENAILKEDYWSTKFMSQPEGSWPVKEYIYDNSHIASLVNPRLNVNTVNIDSFMTELFQRFTFIKIVRILSCYFMWTKQARKDVVMAQSLAKELVYSLAAPSKEQISGVKRQFLVEEKKDEKYKKGQVWCISRPFTLEGQNSHQRKLRLLDGTGLAGRSILRHLHIHCASSDTEMSRMYEMGVFCVGARRYFRKMQSDCFTCRRIRKIAVEQYQGESIQMKAQHMPPYFYSHADMVGPIKIKIRRNIVQKGYILSLTCAWSRHVSFRLLTDMRSNTFLQALIAVGSSLGGVVPYHLYSDFGTNIVGIRKLEGENVGDNERNRINRELQTTFTKNGINLHLSSPRSPWKMSLIERLHRELKNTLRRANVLNQSLGHGEWDYLLSRTGQILNERPLNIRFVNEGFEVLTPTHLVFGRRQNIFPRTEQLKLNLQNVNLYSELDRLEKNVAHWKSIWDKTYLQQIQRFTVFKTKTRTLQPEDVCLILDHKSSGGFYTFGKVVEMISPRTAKLEYVQRPAQMDKEGNIERRATIAQLVRPVQKLVFLVSPSDKCNDVDPFFVTREGDESDDAPAPTVPPTSPTPSATSAQEHTVDVYEDEAPDEADVESEPAEEELDYADPTPVNRVRVTVPDEGNIAEIKDIKDINTIRRNPRKNKKRN